MNPEEQKMELDKDRVAAYLLGSMDPAETEEVELMLARSGTLREYANWLRASVDLLPQGVEQHSPPPELKQRLMAEVRRDAAAHAKQRKSAPRRRWGLSVSTIRPAFAATAGAIVAVAVGVGYLAGNNGPDVSRIDAQIAPSLSSARATLVRGDGQPRLEVESLPALSRGSVYQVWLRRGERIEPSRPFVPGRDRKASSVIPEGLKGVDEVMVTREPTGGSKQPTSAPLLRVAL